MKAVCFACGAEYTEQHQRCRACGSKHIAEVMRTESVHQSSDSSNREFGIKEIGEILRVRAPWLYFKSSSTEPTLTRKPIDIEELDGFSYLLAKGWQWLRLLGAALVVLGVIGAVLFAIFFVIARVVMSSIRMGNH